MSKERLKKNPLRVLDSKEENDIKIVQNSPSIIDFLDDESKRMFENLINGLEKLSVNYNINRFLVRGLDYYNHSAFEYVTEEKKSQNTVLAGGRYNQLFASIGGKDLSGVGWAAGIERIVLNLGSKNKEKFTISIFSNSPEFDFDVLNLIKSLKPKDDIKINFLNSGNFKKKLSKASKINSFACIILAENEWKEKKLIWKDLINDSQEIFSLDMIEEFLNHKLDKK